LAIEVQRLNEIREGRRGIALGIYIDVGEDDWEDYSLAVPTVLALDEGAGERVLDAIRDALLAGTAQEVSDDASDALSILLASTLQDQALVARMLEGIGGRARDMMALDLAPAS
jgi:hypothetical protein